MRPKNLIPLVVLLLFTSACGNAPQTATVRSSEEIFNSVATLAAQTSTAQQAMITPQPTATLTSVASLTPFAPTATLYPTPTAVINSYTSYSACDDSLFITDVTTSNYSAFAPGETFTKTWRIKNTGTCTWNKHYAIVLFDGDSMSGEMTMITQAVDPDEVTEISVVLTAPDEAGTYVGYWVLVNRDEVPFGNYFYVEMTVSGDAPTATETSVNTPTPEVIGTPTATQTEMPTMIR